MDRKQKGRLTALLPAFVVAAEDMLGLKQQVTTRKVKLPYKERQPRLYSNLFQTMGYRAPNAYKEILP